jgi:exopolyphosphatase / guanosine-5'-triphosphate,3'-diphosphate pyrophosphatase
MLWLFFEICMQNGTRLAAVDLGSNSFRLEIGHLDHGQIHRTEYLKETVRQGNGLDEERNLTAEAMQRGWDCLARFGERLSNFKPSQVRAVATQTLREARNRDVFLARANSILGFPIDIISGQEEARLIYQGVSHLLPQSDEKRLVIDIGGRSTEIVLGYQLTTTKTSSYRLGSVAWSMKYFPNGYLDEASFNRAEIAAKAILDDVLTFYKRDDWEVAYGSSGTIGAVSDILAVNGTPETGLTHAGLQWIREKLIKAQHIDNIKLAGLKDDRRAVLAGGISILCALFDLLEIEELKPADGALRHGVLYDLLDRERGEIDVRGASVKRLSTNFSIDLAQANRVAKVATDLFSQTQSLVSIDAADFAEDMQTLTWAAQLHEIGCQISHSDYHKHGAYILDNADIAGFAVPESHQLSMLVFGHRGKLKKLELELNDSKFSLLLLSLRLAVILCHARNDLEIKNLCLKVFENDMNQFFLTCPARWAKDFPQSAHLLREETIAWKKVNRLLMLQGCDV